MSQKTKPQSKKQFTFRFTEEVHGVIGFEADNLEEAEKLFAELNEGEIEEEELPNHWRKTKSSECDIYDLAELTL